MLIPISLKQSYKKTNLLACKYFHVSQYYDEFNVSQLFLALNKYHYYSRQQTLIAWQAAKQEVDSIIDDIFGKDKFDLIINGDEFEGKGKPDPAPFNVALQRLNAGNTNNPSPDDVTVAVVVENAPLGVKAANNASMPCIVTLNTSPLTIDDFKGLISDDRIFKDTISAGKFLKNWCQ